MPALSKAELLAKQATDRRPFGVNLAEIKSTVAEILSQVGRFDFFNNFTPHKIQHVDEMLSMLDWVVPSPTSEQLTLANWFLIVLSCYFHDLGLLITKYEFDNRSKSGYMRFCEHQLFIGDRGEDYRQKVDRLSPEERDRVLYQEFVRSNHGSRVRSWIENNPSDLLGAAAPAMTIIAGLLSNLDPLVRSDLALICESHTLGDLDDVKKYPVVRPYDNSETDTANIQYCAVVLRTVDLLQITKDRAPATLFRLIDPSDPQSQAEWSKQAAVKRIRPKARLQSSGEVDKGSQSETIEVYANFTDPIGYFALTSYLDYASEQLKLSHRLIKQSQADGLSGYEFPWRSIDTTNCEVTGFIKEQFEFQIDQSKILNLLTGHTIYNNGLVVLRELVQNSLDAIRLQSYLDQEKGNPYPEAQGKIHIHYDETTAQLEIRDNGTGMSQDVIVNHLLRVGSSKYQDEKFKKSHPSFAPISRFGIGVLTTFMVADEVDILTSEETDPEVRLISLRSVHGKYLIKLLPKQATFGDRDYPQRGTTIRLKLRRGIPHTNLLQALRRWIVFPGCEVTFQEGDKPLESIGYESPKAALESLIVSLPGTLRGKFKVEEKQGNGFQLAYVLHWSESFHEWGLVSGQHPEFHERPSALVPMPCVCVHGVAVEFTTPGFKSPSFASILNTFGRSAPKTNVARDALEENVELQVLYKTVYASLLDAVQNEAVRLHDEEGYTKTKALNEVPFLVSSFTPAAAKDPEELTRQMEEIRVCMIEGVESQITRIPLSLHELVKLSSFWTVECEVVRSAESLLGQFVSETPIHSAVDSLSSGKFILPRPLLCNLNSLGLFRETIFRKFEVAELKVSEVQQRVDLRWTCSSGKTCLHVSQLTETLAPEGRRLRDQIGGMINQGRRGNIWNQWIALDDMTLEIPADIGAVSTLGRLILLPSQPITKFLREMFLGGDLTGSSEAFVYLALTGNACAAQGFSIESHSLNNIQSTLHQLEAALRLQFARKSEFLDAIRGSCLRTFNPLLWDQRSAEFMQAMYQ